MLRLPEEFLHGEILQARRVRGLILARARYGPGLRIPPHAHDHARFVFVLRGSFTETVAGRERQATPSLLIYRPPVALAAGFCDQSHFSRAFKRHTGFSPAEYRAVSRGLPR